jgi:hypothetical protein
MVIAPTYYGLCNRRRNSSEPSAGLGKTGIESAWNIKVAGFFKIIGKTAARVGVMHAHLPGVVAQFCAAMKFATLIEAV